MTYDPASAIKSASACAFGTPPHRRPTSIRIGHDLQRWANWLMDNGLMYGSQFEPYARNADEWLNDYR